MFSQVFQEHTGKCQREEVHNMHAPCIGLFFFPSTISYDPLNSSLGYRAESCSSTQGKEAVSDRRKGRSLFQILPKIKLKHEIWGANTSTKVKYQL